MFTKRGIVPMFLIVALTIGLVAAQPSRPGASSPRISAAATPGERHKGLVVPNKQVVLTAPLDGILAKIHVENGQAIKSGDTLALMDNEIQLFVVEAAKLRADSRAAINVAELALEEAKLEVEKAEDLRTRKVGTDWEVRQKKVIQSQKAAELVAEQEQVRLAAANLKLEDAKLRKHAILAPFDGVVIDVVAEEGASLARNDKVIALADLSTLEAKINLPNTREFYEAMRSRIGQTFKLKAGDPVNADIEGRLKNVREVIDPGSATFLCEFTIENKDAKMPAGFAVDLIWPQ